jgi:hypothetical protein
MTAELAAQGMSVITQMAQRVELVVAHNAEFDKKWFGLSRNGQSIIPALLNFRE